MIDKVVIAAAGKGTRMLDLARNRPKHIIPVAGKPFIYYLLSNLKEAGLTKVILVAGFHKAKMAEFASSVASEFDITIVDQFEKISEERYGTACAVEAAAEFVGDDQFVALYGDNLYSPGSLLAVNIYDSFTYVSGMRVPEPERYGVLVEQDGQLKHILEKPSAQAAEGHLVNIGLYKFTPEIFQAIKQIDLSPRGEYELTDAVSLLANQNLVRVVKLDDYWLDFGRPSDIAKVSDFINARPSFNG